MMTCMERIPPEALLADYPEPIRDAGEWLRAVVRRAVPDVIERVRPGWRLIGYDVPRERGRTTYFCYVAPEPAHVHLGFEYGVLMRDEDRLLQGAGVTRRVRWLTFSQRDSVPEIQLERLVLDGLSVALMPRANRLGRLLDVSETQGGDR
jgi:hypothetical protein